MLSICLTPCRTNTDVENTTPHICGDNILFLLYFQAYYREGIALQCLGKFSDALGAFSSGLAIDPKNTQLLTGIIDAVSKSPLKSKRRIFTSTRYISTQFYMPAG